MLTLSKENGRFFKEPFGALFSDFSDAAVVLRDKIFYCVGDVVTDNAFKAGLNPSVCVVDGFTKRAPYASESKVCMRKTSVANPAGTITDELVEALREAVAFGPMFVFVEGEEDLAVIPLIELANDGEYIVYGQPNEGVVVCEVNDDLRALSKRMMRYFEVA